MLPSKSTWAGAVAIAAVALAACDSANSGVTAPDSPIEATGASSARPDASTVIQEFRVCKTYVGVVGPAVTVDFTVDFNADGPGPQDLAGSVVLAEGDCAVVHTYDESNASGGTQVQRVTVTEQVLAGYGASYVLTETVGPVTTVGPQTPGNSASGDMISNPDNGFIVEFINTEIVTGGGEGCTPGYWKQSQHFDSYPAGFDPMTPFIGSTTGFSYDPSLKKPESGNASDLSLLGALTLRGGQQNALIRHAAAGILNANSSGVSYDLSLAEVQNLYNVDLDKGALERANQQGCPLN